MNVTGILWYLLWVIGAAFVVVWTLAILRSGGFALPSWLETAIGFVNGIVFYMLLLTIVGVVLSAGLWAVGSFSNNYTQSINGKKGFLICVAAALAIGAAYVLIGYFFAQGTALTGTGQ